MTLHDKIWMHVFKCGSVTKNIYVDNLAVPHAYLNYSRWVLESRRHGRELRRHILVAVLERFLLDLVVSRTWNLHVFLLCDWFNSDGRGAKYSFPRALDVGFPHTVRAHSSQVVGPRSWKFVIVMNLLHFIILYCLSLKFNTILFTVSSYRLVYYTYWDFFFSNLRIKMVNFIGRQVWLNM